MLTDIGFDSWLLYTALKVLSLLVLSTEVTSQSPFGPFGQLSPTSGISSPDVVEVTDVRKKPVN